MNNDNSTQHSSMFWAQSQDVIGSAWSTFRLWATTVRNTAAQCMIRVKIAKMQSALNRLTDEQLKQIGLARKDIAQHAVYLIGYEYDGL
ncbi:hypothetical protein FEE96_22720 [Parasedimentitalea maritima]|uniref:DUF1127 domain-containing protein n=1 Tax=Parasedimentitalea maritima TaxID=2578117 RepID=A0ABY2UNN3_9RHOB|nr:hypothetical protein [Zongyanglinia marina]TLP55531.1 hypothetical protein FEE96_22720 [Zongyanglinia marina]